MRVLLFTLEYPPFKGGVANVYENIVKYWPCGVETRHGASLLQNDIFVLHNNDGRLINNKLPFLKWLPSAWRLWRFIIKEKINHIIVGHILPLGIAAYIVSKFTKIKYSVILHGMDFTFALRTARKKWIAKKILGDANNIICMNSYVAELVRRLVGDNGAKKIKIVNPGAEARKAENKKTKKQDELKNKYNLENKIVLLSVGRLVKRKGFDKVIEALPKALKEAPNLIYVIAGAGPDEEYLKEIAYKGIGYPIGYPIPNKHADKGAYKSAGHPIGCPTPTPNKHVIFLGKITDEEKWAWLNLCDIFIMPSRTIGGDFEGFGIVYLEANLAGKPVIAGDSGGVRDAVKNNVNGLLVNPESAEEIAEAIIKLAKDKELRRKLGERGRERAVKEFNWERQVEKIYDIITNI
jgi:phosphatidylinositol alpha-1,6-mannosyltransferase